MMFKSFLLVISAATAVDSLAFGGFAAFEAHPGLQQLTQSQSGAKFSVKMDIGKKGDEAHLLLDHLGVELLQDSVTKNERIGLPGVDGPHPKTSTGALALNVFSTPSFIDMSGTQKVRFEKGAWEVIWKKDQMCGALICGFELPTGAKRNSNSATLSAGRVYISFPVWTADGLTEKQSSKKETESRCKEFDDEKNDEIRKMGETSNLFMKAVHYRNAIAAVEKMDFSGIRSMGHVPVEGDVIPIGNGLMLNTKGTIWNKAADFFGEKHAMLGDAVLSPILEDKKDMLMP